MFSIKPHFSREPPLTDGTVWNAGLIRELEIALVNTMHAARLVPVPPNISLSFKVGDKVLVRCDKPKGPKLWKLFWAIPYAIKEERPPGYVIPTDNKRI